jgi:hypothetical protein
VCANTVHRYRSPVAQGASHWCRQRPRADARSLESNIRCWRARSRGGGARFSNIRRGIDFVFFLAFLVPWPERFTRCASRGRLLGGICMHEQANVHGHVNGHVNGHGNGNGNGKGGRRRQWQRQWPQRAATAAGSGGGGNGNGGQRWAVCGGISGPARRSRRPPADRCERGSAHASVRPRPSPTRR